VHVVDLVDLVDSANPVEPPDLVGPPDRPAR
jgi:hypothetical protein